MDSIYNAFWNERIWLPPNTTWKDLENKPGDKIIKPQAADLWLTIPLAVAIYIIRYIVVNFVLVQLGALFNIHKSNKQVSVEHNAVLEPCFRRNKRPSAENLKVLASKANLSVEQVSSWYRARRNLDKTSKLVRLQDSGWKLTYYGAVWIFGMYSFSMREWVWDVQQCWLGFPNHHLDSAIKWFYLTQIAFYLMCAVTHFSDLRRTDFWAMLIHHVVTLGLMCSSYVNNHVRIGCLILITHDVADVNMEFAKTINYLGFVNGSQYAFILFVLCWIVTRLTYYPFVIVRTVMNDVTRHLGDDYLFQRVFFTLLVILLFLHIFWFTLIVRMVITKVTRGRIEGDVRSDSEIEQADENGNNGKSMHHESKKKD